MKIEFEFDENAFRKAVMDAADNGFREAASELQAVVDGVHATHAGHPLDEVKAELQARWHDATGKTPTDEQLTEWSQAIVDGRGINVVYGGMHQ